MRVSVRRLQELCGAQGVSLSALLRRAGVSRNAFYSLARKESALPESLMRIARELGESPLRFLEERLSPEQEARQLIEETDRIAARCPDVDRENVRHTLLLLREKPVLRLRRALRRGRTTDI